MLSSRRSSSRSKRGLKVRGLGIDDFRLGSDRRPERNDVRPHGGMKGNLVVNPDHKDEYGSTQKMEPVKTFTARRLPGGGKACV